jgi:putative intracellular protease/amidase
MEDLSADANSGALLNAALASGKPLGIVCHAPAALLATAGPDGAASPFAGYRLTAFTNAEETQAGLADKARWLLQDRLVQLGADFQEGAPWAPHTVTDRNLHTGQNPASAGPLAAELLKVLP